MVFIGATLGQVTLRWWFGLVVWGFEPLVFVEGKWERVSLFVPLNKDTPNMAYSNSTQVEVFVNVDGDVQKCLPTAPHSDRRESSLVFPCLVTEETWSPS